MYLPWNKVFFSQGVRSPCLRRGVALPAFVFRFHLLLWTALLVDTFLLSGPPKGRYISTPMPYIYPKEDNFSLSFFCQRTKQSCRRGQVDLTTPCFSNNLNSPLPHTLFPQVYDQICIRVHRLPLYDGEIFSPPRPTPADVVDPPESCAVSKAG